MPLHPKQQEIVDNVIKHLKEAFSQETTGHDWWHMYRVWQAAKAIQEKEGGNLFIITLGALLHDVADWKFHDEGEGPKKAREILEKFEVEEDIIQSVYHIVERVSFKGGQNEKKMESLEGKIVQDADRLDALGAIGVARAFAYGGYKKRPLYDPDIPSREYTSFEEYKNAKGTTINHFYEKLLLLKDKMNTPTGKEMAEERHAFLEEYLDEFFAEWEGKR